MNNQILTEKTWSRKLEFINLYSYTRVFKFTKILSLNGYKEYNFAFIMD